MGEINSNKSTVFPFSPTQLKFPQVRSGIDSTNEMKIPFSIKRQKQDEKRRKAKENDKARRRKEKTKKRRK